MYFKLKITIWFLKRVNIYYSQDKSGDFSGRVTDYIKQNNFDKDTICYFCGNFKMIREAMDLLEQKGIPNDQLHAEVYF